MGQLEIEKSLGNTPKEFAVPEFAASDWGAPATPRTRGQKKKKSLPAFIQRSVNKNTEDSIQEAKMNKIKNEQLTKTPQGRNRRKSPNKLNRSGRKINIDLGNNKVKEFNKLDKPAKVGQRGKIAFDPTKTPDQGALKGSRRSSIMKRAKAADFF